MWNNDVLFVVIFNYFYEVRFFLLYQLCEWLFVYHIWILVYLDCYYYYTYWLLLEYLNPQWRVMINTIIRFDSNDNINIYEDRKIAVMVVIINNSGNEINIRGKKGSNNSSIDNRSSIA